MMKKSVSEEIVHPIPPFYDQSSRILILGSFPSVKSRESGFFYGHPQNRFWRVLSTVFGESVPETIEEKKAQLLTHRVALWDVIASCRITGSSDSSIRDAVPNDVATLLSQTDVRAIFTNGKTAQALYDKHLLPTLGIPALCLPSTSPANAAWSMEQLTQAWQAVTLK